MEKREPVPGLYLTNLLARRLETSPAALRQWSEVDVLLEFDLIHMESQQALKRERERGK